MSEDAETYEIGEDWDAEELRHGCERLRAERDAAVADRNLWRICARRLAEVVRELTGAGKEKANGDV